MARFVFAFDALKKFRSNRLLVAKREMGVVEEKLLDLKRQLRQAVDRRSGMLSESLLLGDYVEAASYRIRVIDREILAVEEELHRHKSWVTHLGRELRIVEKLEEKKREQHEAEIRMREKRANDNWVSDNWTRKTTGNLSEESGEGDMST